MFGFRPLTNAELIDVVVVYVQCDGCMASDHSIKWIGIVESVKPVGRYNEATVRLVKNNDDCRDSRDHDLGTRTITIEDGSFQKMSKNLWFIFK